MSKVQCPKSKVKYRYRFRESITLISYAQEAKIMKIKKFEELESWKKARQLTNEIYRTTLTGRFARDFGLKDQIRRAAISILSNIAEGFERGAYRQRGG